MPGRYRLGLAGGGDDALERLATRSPKSLERRGTAGRFLLSGLGLAGGAEVAREPR